MDSEAPYTAVLIERIRHEVCRCVLRPPRAHRRLRRARRAACRGRRPVDHRQADRHSPPVQSGVDARRQTGRLRLGSGRRVEGLRRRRCDLVGRAARADGRGGIARRRVLERRRQGADDGEGRRSVARADRRRRGVCGLDHAAEGGGHRAFARRHQGRVRARLGRVGASGRRRAAAVAAAAPAGTSSGCDRSPTIAKRWSRAATTSDWRRRLVAGRRAPRLHRRRAHDPARADARVLRREDHLHDHRERAGRDDASSRRPAAAAKALGSGGGGLAAAAAGSTRGTSSSSARRPTSSGGRRRSWTSPAASRRCCTRTSRRSSGA